MKKVLQVKGVSEELRSRLESSAEQNYRTLNQEALARLEFSFDLEDALRTKTHQKWIDETMAGTLKPGSIERLKRIAAKVKANR